jgi:hypothetical protein
MPAPDFDWKIYELPTDVDHSFPRPRVAAPAEERRTIELPDMTPWPAPLDKAKILLESAAEVKHALLVQYLYAAFALNVAEDVSDADQQNALEDWSSTLHIIAREEMGHLMTAQNLMLALGLPPNLEREDFPLHKDLYPFAFHLEPLSQRSLAKYITAEAPENASGVDDIVALATDSAGMMVKQVGVLYGLLGLIFSTADLIVAGGSGSQSWDDMLRELALAGYQQAPPKAWHLPDNAIDAQTLNRQADPGRWQRGTNRVHQIADRSAALDAIRDVAEQGEGPTSGLLGSHFGRFLDIYRGHDGITPFPSATEWVPARAVPTDPKPDGIVEPRTQRWVQLADIRYGLLLGFIEHYLLTSDEQDRSDLANWVFSEMFTLAALARMLTTLPQGQGVAALPFTLPTPQHLPDDEIARWDVHAVRTRAAIAKVQEMLGADAADAKNQSLPRCSLRMLCDFSGSLLEPPHRPPRDVSSAKVRWERPAHPFNGQLDGQGPRSSATRSSTPVLSRH